MNDTDTARGLSVFSPERRALTVGILLADRWPTSRPPQFGYAPT